MSQVVPTSVRALSADVVLVSFLSGFPFATGNAGVRRVGINTHTDKPFIGQRTTVTDMLPVAKAGGG